jgi:hypothetical protein
MGDARAPVAETPKPTNWVLILSVIAVVLLAAILVVVVQQGQ